MIPDNVQILFADLQPTLVAGSQTISPEALTRSAVALDRVDGYDLSANRIVETAKYERPQA